MHLVMLSCLVDDFPIRLFGDATAAKQFAETVSFDTCIQQAEDFWSMNASAPVCICVVAFNADGLPINRTIVRSSDDEPVAA